MEKIKSFLSKCLALLGSHKKAIAIILVVCFVVFVTGMLVYNNIDFDGETDTPETTMSLEDTKLAYLTQLAEDYYEDDFTAEDWEEVQSLIVEAQTGIASALTFDTLESQWGYYITELEKFDSYSNIAEAFEEYKQDAIDEVESAYNTKTYTDSNLEAVLEIVEDFNDDIEDCTTSEDVDSLKEETLSLISAIESIESEAISSEGEFNIAVSTAISAIENYKISEVYYSEEATGVASVKSSNITVISTMAYSISGVQLIEKQVANAYEKVDEYLTKAEVDAIYVAGLLEEIESTFDTADYYTNQIAEILSIVDEFEQGIALIEATEVGLVQLAMDELAETAIEAIADVKDKDAYDEYVQGELATAKEEAKAEISEYLPAGDWSDTQISSVNFFKSVAYVNIESATDIDVISSLVETLKSDVNVYLGVE